MTQKFFISLSLVLFLQNSMFASFLEDDIYLYKANRALENNEYKKVLDFYKKIKNKNDAIYFNMANIYYKLNNFSKAIKLAKKIKQTKLLNKAFHLMGNAYARSFEYDKAIAYYKKSLELKVNEKIKYNFHMVQVQRALLLENQKLREKRDLKMRKGKDFESENAQFFDEAFDLDNFDLNMSLSEDKKEKNISNETALVLSKNDIQYSIKIEKNNSEEFNSSTIDFSNYLQQKWDNKLQLKVHTLLIPLEKGNINDSKKPW